MWWKRIGDLDPVLDKEPEYNFEVIDYLVQEIILHEASWQAYFTRYNINPFTVIYEDFVHNYEQTAVSILDWHNVSYQGNLEFGPRLLEKQADEVSEKWVQRYLADKQKKENTMESFSPFQITTWNPNLSES